MMETNNTGDYSCLLYHQRLALLKYGEVELRTWPEGDFVGNTRGNERVKEAKNDVIRGLNARRCFSRIRIE